MSPGDYAAWLSRASGRRRCGWCGVDPQYVAYHDREWGLPVTDDQRLFEKISLEGFQAGLSWLTILRKRESFRRAFRAFDFHAVARFRAPTIERLLGDTSIVRHRGKIEAVIHNAARAIELEREFGSLARFFWSFEGPRRFPGVVARTERSTDLSTQLRARGWKFVGPTTCYAFMQAMGLVNDHVPGCSLRAEVSAARRELKSPLETTGPRRKA